MHSSTISRKLLFLGSHGMEMKTRSLVIAEAMRRSRRLSGRRTGDTSEARLVFGARHGAEATKPDMEPKRSIAQSHLDIVTESDHG